MTCRELIDFLDDYVDGRLPPRERDAFDRHLGLCRDCRHYLHGYGRTVELVRGLTEEDAVARMPPDLADAIRAARRSA